MNDGKTKDKKGMESRNSTFSNEKMGQGFKAESMKGVNPCDAIGTEGAHDTSPEKDSNAMREDKGS